MSFGSGSSSFQVKKFETQEEVEEKKRKRQEHWDKVRKPDDPEECPEEETRSLFEQLEDNKASKQKEFEEQFKLRNSVQGLEEEETKFLNFVSNRQLQLEKEREKEENVVLEQMKQEAAVKRVAEKNQPVQDSKKPSPSTSSTAKKSQQSLLMGAIKRKSTDASPDEAGKRKRSESDTSGNSISPSEDKLLKLIDTSAPVAQVAGILPGIGSYEDNSSDSDSSSAESDIEDYMKTKKVIRVHIDQH